MGRPTLLGGAILLTVAVTLVAALPNYAYLPFGLHAAPTGIEYVALGLVLVFVAPPVEEILFRNVIQKRLAERYRPALAIGLASFLFALLHVPADYAPVSLASATSIAMVGLAGIVFGIVYHRTGTVLAPTIVHAVLSGLGFLAIATTIL